MTSRGTRDDARGQSDGRPDGGPRARLIDLDLATRQSIRGLVYQALRQAIIDGRIPSSERLIEQKLAEELGISRTPIREALQKLEIEGLVVPSPPRGFIVRRVSRRELEEIFEIRRLIEPFAAGLAVDVLLPADFEVLEQTAAEALHHAFGATPDAHAVIDAQRRFYNVFADRCPNSQLGKLVRDLRDLFIFLDRTIGRSTLLSMEQRQEITRITPLVLQAASARERAAVERFIAERLDLLRAGAVAHASQDSPIAGDSIFRPGFPPRLPASS